MAQVLLLCTVVDEYQFRKFLNDLVSWLVVISMSFGVVVCQKIIFTPGAIKLVHKK